MQEVGRLQGCPTSVTAALRDAEVSDDGVGAAVACRCCVALCVCLGRVVRPGRCWFVLVLLVLLVLCVLVVVGVVVDLTLGKIFQVPVRRFGIRTLARLKLFRVNLLSQLASCCWLRFENLKNKSDNSSF